MIRDRPSTKYPFFGAIAIHPRLACRPFEWEELDALGYQEKPGRLNINRVFLIK
ncbi:MAG: hypothetical protein MRK02_15800 [Candidatus Scalindua sp.]|nr:hypothetical protein [Candidatus Scalindua sp.]